MDKSYPWTREIIEMRRGQRARESKFLPVYRLAFNSNTVDLQRQLGKSKSLTILKLGKYNAILLILIY